MCDYFNEKIKPCRNRCMICSPDFKEIHQEYLSENNRKDFKIIKKGNLTKNL